MTAVDDALAAAEAGADAIGLNFYAKSPRAVEPGVAREIAAALAALGQRAPLVVGVFVNESPQRIAELASQVPLGAVQLHGDEPADFPAALPPSVPWIRAERMPPGGLSACADWVRRAEGFGRRPAAVLIDALAEGGYGGTGRRVDSLRVARERPLLGPIPVVLAGGLGPANVASAIAEARPDGVDVASGVEWAPGRKDQDAVRRFVHAAREAFAVLHSPG